MGFTLGLLLKGQGLVFADVYMSNIGKATSQKRFKIDFNSMLFREQTVFDVKMINNKEIIAHVRDPTDVFAFVDNKTKKVTKRIDLMEIDGKSINPATSFLF